MYCPIDFVVVASPQVDHDVLQGVKGQSGAKGPMDREDVVRYREWHGMHGQSARSKITQAHEGGHLISVEKHDGARIVKLIHRVEVGHLCRVYKIDNGIVFNKLRNGIQHLHKGSLLVMHASFGCTMRVSGPYLVHLHASGIIVVAKTYDYQSIFFRQNGLVNSPTTR